jgi:hypothetical protein
MFYVIVVLLCIVAIGLAVVFWTDVLPAWKRKHELKLGEKGREWTPPGG